MKKLHVWRTMFLKRVAGAESILMKLFRKANNFEFMSETFHVIVDDTQIC